MKRLVDQDDPDDEVVRLLIRAGANHQPAPGSKLRLMAALGVGSAVGLSASEVLAWLGTSSGKVALTLTVVGAAAGGAYVMASSPEPLARVSVPAMSVPAMSVPAMSVPAAPAAASPDAAPVAAPSVAEPERAVQPEPPAAAASPGAPEPRLERQPARRTPARAAPPRARVPAPEPTPAASDEAAREASLSEETLWVDRLRVAAEGHDRPAFERLLEQYVERFPEGQLRPEVNRLELSLP
jgi:hypothetical protein